MPLTIPRGRESPIVSLAIAPADPQTVYAGTGGGVFKTTDGGATWKRRKRRTLRQGETVADTKPTGAHRMLEGYVQSLVVDPGDPETVYAGTWSEAFSRPRTAGRAGSASPGGGSPDPRPERPRDDLCGCGRLGLRRLRAASSRAPMAGGPGCRRVCRAKANVNDFAPSIRGHSEILYAGKAKGLMKSTDGGNNWRRGGPESSVYV